MYNYTMVFSVGQKAQRESYNSGASGTVYKVSSIFWINRNITEFDLIVLVTV